MGITLIFLGCTTLFAQQGPAQKTAAQEKPGASSKTPPPEKPPTVTKHTIECTRHDWFWWGDGDPFHFNIKKRSEVHKSLHKEDDRPAGAIRNVLIQNVIAHGRGSSICNGHPESWLDGITLANVKLFISHDPMAPYDKAVHALKFQQARNLKLKDVEVIWEKPESERWQSALYLEEVEGLEIEGFFGPAGPSRGAGAGCGP